ncbi:MAG: methyltransferase domain-containing protein [Betaproteobacteria bacterium]|nr:methyltransferase domain-containing protein [Betaproteobacteria bacterium]
MNSTGDPDFKRSIGYRWAHGPFEDQQRLHRMMEAGTAALLRQAGLHEGMRVADIGCGAGLMTLRLAEEVGPDGLVAGLDEDEAQLDIGRRAAESEGRRNLWFERASVYETGLPRSSFGLVYARCLFSRLERPWDALAELVTLLEPGGRLVCEEIECAPAAAVTLPGRCLDELPIEWERGDMRAGTGVPPRLSWALGEAGLTHVGATFARLPTPAAGLSVPFASRASGQGTLALWQVWGQRPPSV